MINLAMVISIVVLAFVLMFLSYFKDSYYMDLSPLAYIVPAAFGELGAVTAFYIWKAKAENCRKNPDINARLSEIKKEEVTVNDRRY
jgi:hypothetical protein